MNNIFNIFYINLEYRKDRKKLLEKEFEKCKDKLYTFNIRRINASKDDFGPIGCGKSHIKSLKEAKRLNLDFVIIMEDDIVLKEELVNTYFDIIQKTNNWDVIILSGHSLEVGMRKKKGLHFDDILNKKK